MEARLDELLHRGGLVNNTLHHVVNRLHLHRRSALAHLPLQQEISRDPQNCRLDQAKNRSKTGEIDRKNIVSQVLFIIAIDGLGNSGGSRISHDAQRCCIEW